MWFCIYDSWGQAQWIICSTLWLGSCVCDSVSWLAGLPSCKAPFTWLYVFGSWCAHNCVVITSSEEGARFRSVLVDGNGMAVPIRCVWAVAIVSSLGYIHPSAVHSSNTGKQWGAEGGTHRNTHTSCLLTPVKVFMLCNAFWASRAAFLV